MQTIVKDPFPRWLSLTVTNSCNLRCRMCGQWGIEGYMKTDEYEEKELPVDAWLKMVDSIPDDQFPLILVRGGEPFRYAGMIELLTALRKRKFFVTIDTNGFLLEKYADAIVQSGVNNLTVSVDGPQEVHDYIRGVKGTFQKVKKGVAAIYEAREKHQKEITVGLNFTISGDNYQSLGDLPDAARELNIPSMSTVPYYYYSNDVGQKYEKFMADRLNCQAHSWRGFHRESSGVDGEELINQFKKLERNLGNIELGEYMALTETDYRTWFTDDTTEVGAFRCLMPWKLLDIQPNGDVNFCIDLPDYIAGNINESSLAEIWDSHQADRFREVLQKELFPACARCGAKYMSKI